MERRILHIDMDAFFASVEQVLHPELRGKPLIVGGDKTDTRGVVCTASYEARVYGIHSAMPLVQAKRLCPHGIFMRGNFEHYRAASEKVRAILETVSPLVEAASIDEAYVDVSGSQRLFGGDDAIAGEATDLLGDLETAVTKWSISFHSARTLMPEASYALIEEKAGAALARLGDFRPYRLEGPISLEISFKNYTPAELLAYLPGVERVDSHTVRYVGRDMVGVSRFLEVATGYQVDLTP